MHMAKNEIVQFAEGTWKSAATDINQLIAFLFVWYRPSQKIVPLQKNVHNEGCEKQACDLHVSGIQR